MLTNQSSWMPAPLISTLARDSDNEDFGTKCGVAAEKDKKLTDRRS